MDANDRLKPTEDVLMATNIWSSLVQEFLTAYPNQPEPPGWDTCSQPGARRLNTIYIMAKGERPTLCY